MRSPVKKRDPLKNSRCITTQSASETGEELHSPSNTKEVWRELNEPGGYAASNLGRIKRLRREIVVQNGDMVYTAVYKEMVLKGSFDNHGYLRFRYKTHINGGKSYKIHRLVAQAFIDNPDNKKEVNHKNGITHDNRVENLEWATRLENQRHAWQTGLIKKLNKKRTWNHINNQFKLTKEQINEIRERYKNRKVAKCTQKTLAREYGVHYGTINVIITRRASYKNDI